MSQGPHSSNNDEERFLVRCDDRLSALWAKWIGYTRATMHIEHEEIGDDLSAHMQNCFTSTRKQIVDAIARLRLTSPRDPRRVLEIGCSTGFKTFALQRQFPDAEVFGVDPDAAAIELACGMGKRLDRTGFPRVPEFREGVGEKLPFDDDSFDLIVCVTVIEHVTDVDRCLAEIARVMRPGGLLYLEAPNYLWPFEPHVRAIMLPLGPKPLLRLLVRLQGNARYAGYVDHLKFVHPHWLERRFRELKLDCRNLYLEKIRDILNGRTDAIAYRRLAGILRMLGRWRLGNILIAPFAWLGFYPSIMYAVRKPGASDG